MRNIYRLVVALLLCAFFCSAVAQEFLSESKINALKALNEVAIVIRPNLTVEVYSVKEIADLVQLGLKRNAPELKVLSPTSSANWLAISAVTSALGSAVELTLYRWVTVADSGERIFAPVWTDASYLFGSTTRQSLREAIDDLGTSFAADFARAQNQER